MFFISIKKTKKPAKHTRTNCSSDLPPSRCCKKMKEDEPGAFPGAQTAVRKEGDVSGKVFTLQVGVRAERSGLQGASRRDASARPGAQAQRGRTPTGQQLGVGNGARRGATHVVGRGSVGSSVRKRAGECLWDPGNHSVSGSILQGDTADRCA